MSLLQSALAIGFILLLVAMVFVAPLFALLWWLNRKFRIHLTTVLFSIFVAGFLLLLNTQSTRFGIESLRSFPEAIWPDDYAGWPVPVPRSKLWTYEDDKDFELAFEFGMAINVITALNLLSIAAIGFEKWADRKVSFAPKGDLRPLK